MPAVHNLNNATHRAFNNYVAHDPWGTSFIRPLVPQQSAKPDPRPLGTYGSLRHNAIGHSTIKGTPDNPITAQDMPRLTAFLNQSLSETGTITDLPGVREVFTQGTSGMEDLMHQMQDKIFEKMRGESKYKSSVFEHKPIKYSDASHYLSKVIKPTYEKNGLYEISIVTRNIKDAPKLGPFSNLFKAPRLNPSDSRYLIDNRIFLDKAAAKMLEGMLIPRAVEAIRGLNIRPNNEKLDPNGFPIKY